MNMNDSLLTAALLNEIFDSFRGRDVLERVIVWDAAPAKPVQLSPRTMLISTSVYRSLREMAYGSAGVEFASMTGVPVLLFGGADTDWAWLLMQDRAAATRLREIT